MIEMSETTSSCEERGKVYLGHTGSIVTWFISGVFCLWQTLNVAIGNRMLHVWKI